MTPAERTSHDTTTLQPPRREHWALRAGSVIADLRSPLYDEERQRDVWNEASAVGFQLMLWAGLLAGSAMLWIGGDNAVPYSLVTVAVVSLGCISCLGYAQRLGVVDRTCFRPTPRLALCILLVAAYLGGLLYATVGELGQVTIISGGVGGVAGGAGAAIALIRPRRRNQHDGDQPGA